MTRAVLLTVLALTALRVPVGLALEAMLPDTQMAAFVGSMLQSVVLFALPGLMLAPSWRAPAMKARDGAGWAMLTVGAALAARAAVTPLNAAWAGLVRAEANLRAAPEDPVGRLVMILALAVVPAVSEELFFRGALLPRLLQSASRWQALCLTTLMFALMHGSLAGLPGHLLISLLLTLTMMHSGRLLIPMGLHLLFNLLALIWPEGTLWLGWGGGVLLAAVMICLVVRLPRGKDRRLPLADGLICAVVLLVMAAQYVF